MALVGREGLSLSRYSRRSGSGSGLDVVLWPLFEFLLALIGAEGILFPSKLRLEFSVLFVDVDAANWISCHVGLHGLENWSCRFFWQQRAFRSIKVVQVADRPRFSFLAKLERPRLEEISSSGVHVVPTRPGAYAVPLGLLLYEGKSVEIPEPRPRDSRTLVRGTVQARDHIHGSRKFRWAILGLLLYLTFCVVGGTYLADGALHPARRPLNEVDTAAMREVARDLSADLEEVAITAADGVVLSGWSLSPEHGRGDAVILLHGLGDNRSGMTGYAQLLLRHGFSVLLPDARAHGVSGGDLAAYGLVDRNDVRAWIEFLEAREHPHCIFGFGESMGAAQLLQSLDAGILLCAVAVESPFANFREIAYDRMGQPFHLGPWVGRTLLRPLVEIALLRARWKYGLDMQQVSPEESVATTLVPVLLIHGQVDGNIPVRHSRLIHVRNPNARLWEVPGADHCGAISTAPQEFERTVVEWFGAHQTKATRHCCAGLSHPAAARLA